MHRMAGYARRRSVKPRFETRLQIAAGWAVCPAMVMMGPIMGPIMGLVFLVFPGGKATLYELAHKEKDFLHDVVLGAPLLHKVAYGVAMLAALGVTTTIWD